MAAYDGPVSANRPDGVAVSGRDRLGSEEVEIRVAGGHGVDYEHPRQPGEHAHCDDDGDVEDNGAMGADDLRQALRRVCITALRRGGLSHQPLLIVTCVG